MWDDAAHLTHPALRSLRGLARIWTDLGATQQYYPLTHTAFWIQSALWGDSVLGHHLVNVALHAGSAFLVVLLARRLGLPGAVLAGVVFALHPVHVESVAWMSELKNTLSTLLYLGAALAWLAFDESRRRAPYGAALGLFLLALLAKTVTATLPVALAAVVWWRRGRLRPREDLLPLAPFAVLGAAAGLFTAWVERHVIGARGAEFDLSMVERGLLAGRAFWFYLGKLVWPADLAFTYPRWNVDAGAAWQLAFPLALAALATGGWLLRRRTRAPLAVLALYLAGLAPALGFVDVFPFRYSYVADHFQYLASIPVFVAFAAAAATLVRRLAPGARRAAYAGLVLAVGVPLALLTWRQSADYASAETLYRATLARNPASWMAHNNLARILLETGRRDEARAHVTEALRLQPGVAEHHNNVGRLLVEDGNLEAAAEHLEAALRLDPGFADARSNLGVTRLRQGRPAEALAEFEAALRLAPAHPEARSNLASARYALAAAALQAGRVEEGLRHLTAALDADPGHAQARNDLAVTLHLLGRTAEALPHYREAARLAPGDAVVRNNYGLALLAEGRRGEAAEQFAAALAIEPAFAEARANLERAGGTAPRADGRP